MKGLFIAIEGIDGSGKTAVVAEVAKRLTARGTTVIVESEPTRSEAGMLARKAVTDDALGYGGEAAALLFAADRAEHVKVIAALQRVHDVVLCDRYKYSSFAYQASYLDVVGPLWAPLKWLSAINAAAPDPDMAIWLDVPVDVAMHRVAERGSKVSEPNAEKIGSADFWYREMHARGWLTRVDAMRSFDEVVSEVEAMVTARLGERA